MLLCQPWLASLLEPARKTTMRSSNSLFFETLLIILLVGRAHGDVGDPTVETDHPYYPGEGAAQTIEQCVARARAGKTTIQDKAIGVYLWLLAHQYHLASPQEWSLPGVVPDSARDNQEMIVYDANRARFSYGYGLCGTVHAWNEPYWRALGLRSRRRAFPGHVNSEIEYEGAWHTFDTDMAGLVFRKDSVVAGYADMARDPELIATDHSPLPRYPFAWPEDFQTMKAGWREIARGGTWYSMYHSGYAAHPGIVHLRAGESFTRIFDRDFFGGPAHRHFWQHQAGGPFRDWTYVNIGAAEQFGDRSRCRGDASYCNALFVYRPNLATAAYREGVIAQSPNLLEGGPLSRLYSRDGQPAWVIFHHFSPYVICGEPVDGANPMTGSARDGFSVAGQAVGDVGVEVSADQGQSWQAAGTVTGPFHLDLTDRVKGRYGWQVRFHWKDTAGLNALTFTTVAQVSQSIYPRLKAGGCQVTYRAASRAVVPVLPDFTLAESIAGRFEQKSLRSANVVYTGRSRASRFAYQVRGNKPGEVAFRVEAPTDLLQVVAAARFNVPIPPADGCDFRLDVSADEGKTWQSADRVTIPKDDEFSSGWVYGSADVSGRPTRKVLARVHFYTGGYTAGLMAVEMYGIYRTPPPQALKLTYAWKEGGTRKQYVEAIPASAERHRFTVPTGKEITDLSVRLEAP
jgi:hypothetical protein